MRKITIALAGAAALLGATSASAATFIDPINPVILAAANTETFGDVFVAQPGAFTDVFSFVIGAAASASSTVTTISLLGGNDIDFSSILLDGTSFTQTGFDPNAENFQLLATNLSTGTHNITVNGSVVSATGNGSYSGTLNLGPAVPEPATWALMLLGFGGVGVALRRRKRVTSGLMQIA